MSEVAVVPGAKSVIRRFSLRRMRTGIILFAWFAAVESLAQSFTIVTAYPNEAERAKLIYGLASNAALGMFYGDRHADILSPGGYMVYRILPILALIGAIWTLTYITKMLRGQEENGRWELLLASQATNRQATIKTLIGAGTGVLISFIIIAVIVALAGKSPKLNFSLAGTLLYALALVSGAVFALGVGTITSQLAATRRKAVIYGLLVVVGLFMIRAVGNIIDNLAWIKNLTPFGWIDKLYPYTHSQPIWLVPLAILTVICIGVGVWLAGKRDMGESLIADTGDAKPKLRLLNSQLGFAFRSTRGSLITWLLSGVALAAVVAAIDKTVAKSLSSTDSLGKTFSNLSGNPYAHIEIAYLSAASFMVVIILFVMATTGLGSAREEEASSRLDNFVSGTTSRTNWLLTRLGLLVGMITLTTMVSNLVVWLVVKVQGIDVSLVTLLFGGLNILGPVILLLGTGVLFFGIKPRLTTIVMYAVIGWSFTIDIIAAAIKANKYLADTSLLHHISLVPAASANWKTFSILVAIGLMLMAVGTRAFEKRDLEAE